MAAESGWQGSSAKRARPAVQGRCSAPTSISCRIRSGQAAVVWWLRFRHPARRRDRINQPFSRRRPESTSSQAGRNESARPELGGAQSSSRILHSRLMGFQLRRRASLEAFPAAGLAPVRCSPMRDKPSVPGLTMAMGAEESWRQCWRGAGAAEARSCARRGTCRLVWAGDIPRFRPGLGHYSTSRTGLATTISRRLAPVA